MTVYVDRVESYDVELVAASVRKAFTGLDLKLPKEPSVVLKPNIVGEFSQKSAAVTNPNVVEAVIQILRETGVRNITVCEGPGVGQDVEKTFEKTGYKNLCERLDVPLVDLNSAERVSVPWVFGKIKLPKIILKSDYYINIPKMKTHGQTKVTLAMKNQKGLLLPEDKKRFHVRWGLNKAIVELAKTLSPNLNIVDGVIAMEGEGPLRGRKINANVLVYGENMVEVDAATVMLMGYKPDDVEHIAFAANDRLGSLKPEVLGKKMVEYRRDFAKANQEYGHVLNIYSWRNPHACSMCIQSFSDAIKLAVKTPRYWLTKVPKLTWYALWMKLHLVQGKKACLPEMDGRVICFGNCTKELAETHGLSWIPGCPPKPEDVLDAL